MRIAWLCLSLALLANAAPRGAGLFEDISSAAGPRWRGWGEAEGLVVEPGRFALRAGDHWQRFDWDASLGLIRLEAEQRLESRSYWLQASRTVERAHARRLRAVSADGRVSVLYYSGARGLEFDLEIVPGAPPPALRLRSLDAELTLDAYGRLRANGRLLALKPVAYALRPGGGRRTLEVGVTLTGGRLAEFAAAPALEGERLIIDPVITSAAYFGAGGEGTPLGIRELADGSLLIAGQAGGPTALGTVLTGPAEVPSDAGLPSGVCFVARLDPKSRQVRFLSYLAASRNLACSDVDQDAEGRILLVGATVGGIVPVTTDALYGTPHVFDDTFLARVSADGRRLDYGTYLHQDWRDVRVRAAAGGRVYVAGRNSLGFPSVAPGYQASAGFAGLLLLNPAARRIEAMTYLGSAFSYTGNHTVAGLALTATEVYLYGTTESPTLPLVRPVQAVPPTAPGGAGFVAGFSHDLLTLRFSTYLGGQPGWTAIDSLVPGEDGALWVAGMASEGSIPGLANHSQAAAAAARNPFAALLRPGIPGPVKGLVLNGLGFDWTGPAQFFIVADGRFCVVAGTSPGVACLTPQGDALDLSGPAGFKAGGAAVVAPSARGGMWTLQRFPDYPGPAPIPYEFMPGALQPEPLPAFGRLMLTFTDLADATPVLTTLMPLTLPADRGPTQRTIELAGRNFASGMRLEVGASSLKVEVLSSRRATLQYAGNSVSGWVNPFLLKPGAYSGRLIVPGATRDLESEPFPVSVPHLPPWSPAAAVGSAARTFVLQGPVYEDTSVSFRGTPLALTASVGSGVYQVVVPPELWQPGTYEMVVTNPPPGGGTQRLSIYVAADRIAFAPASYAAPVRVPADYYQVDQANRVLYVILRTSAGWKITAHGLPGGEALRSAEVAKGPASALVDARISAGGEYLYLFDDSLRVRRVRCDSLAVDLEFQVAQDAPPATTSRPETRQRLMVLEDRPESVVVATPAGRLILYDGAQPRPYTTADFPPITGERLLPLVATGGFVYAALAPAPCIARYAIDDLGFFPAEEFCDIAAAWGRYPEMETHQSGLLLRTRASTIFLSPASASVMSEVGVNVAQNVLASGEAANFDARSGALTNRLRIQRLDTGEPIGCYPPSGGYPWIDPGIFLDDGTLVVGRLISAFDSPSRQVMIVSDWRSVVAAQP